MSVCINYAGDSCIALCWGRLDVGPGYFVEVVVPWPDRRYPGRALRVEWGVS